MVEVNVAAFVVVSVLVLVEYYVFVTVSISMSLVVVRSVVVTDTVCRECGCSSDIRGLCYGCSRYRARCIWQVSMSTCDDFVSATRSPLACHCISGADSDRRCVGDLCVRGVHGGYGVRGQDAGAGSSGAVLEICKKQTRNR